MNKSWEVGMMFNIMKTKYVYYLGGAIQGRRPSRRFSV